MLKRVCIKLFSQSSKGHHASIFIPNGFAKILMVTCRGVGLRGLGKICVFRQMSETIRNRTITNRKSPVPYRTVLLSMTLSDLKWRGSRAQIRDRVFPYVMLTEPANGHGEMKFYLKRVQQIVCVGYLVHTRLSPGQELMLALTPRRDRPIGPRDTNSLDLTCT